MSEAPVPTLTLYRPVGLRELRLIFDAGRRRFPPRLPEQPIFYPVLTHAYAERIAREWNTVDEASGYAGFVLSFEVDAAFAARYEVQTAGGRAHQELWVPSEELDEFNDQIVGEIQVLAAFAGERCELRIDPETHAPVGW